MTTNTKKKVQLIEEAIISYKGFSNKWECRGFKFKIGETFHHDGPVVKACESGFHACEYPLDVFNYYPPSGNRFAVVRQSGDMSRHDGDTKVASATLTVEAEIDLSVLAVRAVDWVMGKLNKSIEQTITGDRSAATNTGHYSAATNTGHQSAATNTGDYSVATNTGYQSAAEVKGSESVAASLGIQGRARAAAGSAIVLCYRDNNGRLLHIRASKVGDNGIKAGVWYSLDADGEFVEVEDREGAE
jgi:hypothetical protein